MDSEWREQHTKDIETAKAAIWWPPVSGEWRSSGEILGLFDWSDLTVLDFGCGVGRNLEWLIDNGGCRALYGMDFPEMLRFVPEYLKDKRNAVKLVRHDRKDQIPDRSIDRILCSLVLQHVPAEQLHDILEWFSEILISTGNIVLYGRDCGDPPLCEPVLPIVEQHLQKVWWHPISSADQYQHSLSLWGRA